MKDGLKIMILQGSDVLKNNLDGVSIKKDFRGMFANSLLQDKLLDVGLKVDKKKESTNDIVMLNFSYGYTSKKVKEWFESDEAKEQKKNIDELIDNIDESIYNKKLQLELRKKENTNADKKIFTDEINRICIEVRELKIKLKDMKNKYNSILSDKKLVMNKEDIRAKLYQEGFKLDFYKKDKATKKNIYNKTISYKFWFRTPSKSRVGNVLFLNEELYNKINLWQNMDIELQENENGEVKLVENEAYKSLTASHQVSKIKINPNNILVVSDIDSYFETMCSKVYYHIADDEVNKNDNEDMCFVRKGISKVKNTLFDGLCLMEDKIFNDDEFLHSYSMCLLRQHYFKSCGFRTYLSKFYKYYCNDNNLDYETYTVKDRYGNNIKVRDIVMVTTENSMKWEKLFSDKIEGFKSWKNHVIAENCNFSICKTEHPSKYGEYQRMSYQHINSLPINKSEAIELCDETIQNVNNMKNDNDLFLDFLKRTANETNNNDMFIDLLKRNKDIACTGFFRTYKSYILNKYKNTLRGGKLIVRGDNLTVCSNVYSLLLHSVGALNKYINNNIIDDYEDETLPILKHGEGISIYTKKFNNNEKVAMFRNPHNSMANIMLGVSHRSNLIDKYFNFNNSICVVNSIKTDIQDRANSMDFDSDFVLATNNKICVEASIKAQEYATIVNCIEKSNKTYKNTMEDLARIDNDLAKAKYATGASSNLAALALSWYCENKTTGLEDVVSIASTLAQCAIDNSKRMYQVDLNKEINRITKLDCMKKFKKIEKEVKGKIVKKSYVAKPYFWYFVKEIKENEKNLYLDKNDTKETIKIKKAKLKAEAKAEKNKKKENIKNHCIEEELCPMDWIQDGIDKIKNSNDTSKYLDIMTLIKNIEGKAKKEQMDKIKVLIEALDNMYKKQNDSNEMDDEDFQQYINIKNTETIDKIKNFHIKDKNMQMLITNTLNDKGLNSKYRLRLLNKLYQTHKKDFLNIFKEN